MRSDDFIFGGTQSWKRDIGIMDPEFIHEN